MDDIDVSKLQPAALTRFKTACASLRAPYKYEEKKYTELVLFFAVQGYSIVKTCAVLGLASSTYYKWQHDFPVFKEACNIAKLHRQVYWDDMLEANLNERNYNFLLFESNYRRRFQCSDQPKVNLDTAFKDASNEERVELVIKSLANQQIDPNQAQTIMGCLKQAADITELETIKIQLETLKEKLETL